MSVYYKDDLIALYHGDCLAVLRTLPTNLLLKKMSRQ